MIRGTVTARLEAVIGVTIFGSGGKRSIVDAIVDTGFTRTFVLPAAAVEELGLARRFRGTALLADGTTCNDQTYVASIEWGGSVRRIVVSAVGNEVLAG